MNRFFGFLIKEFRHILRDRRTLGILIFIPIAQLMLFGFVLTNEIKNINMAVVDYSHSDLSRKLISRINASQYFTVAYPSASENELPALMRSGKIKVAMVINRDFETEFINHQRSSVQIIADGSEPNMARLVVNYTQNTISAVLMDQFSVKPELAAIKPEVRMMFNETMKESYNFVPGLIAVILMLISAMMTALTIAREKESGTMEILLASPIKPIQIIAGKVMPYLLISFINICVILLLGVLVFGVPIKGSLLLFLFECTLFILVALSLGILISTVVKTQMTAMMMSGFGLMLPTLLLSGFIFPIKNMPVVLQVVSAAMPPRWFIAMARDIMIKGSTFADVWFPTLVLGGMTAFLLLVSARKFKNRLE